MPRPTRVSVSRSPHRRGHRGKMAALSRRSPRYRIDIAATAVPLLGGDMAVCRTRDVSEVGLCLDTAAWFPLGTRLCRSLVDPASGNALEVIGDVVREAKAPSWYARHPADRAARSSGARSSRLRRAARGPVDKPSEAAARAGRRRRASPARRDGALRDERLGRAVRLRRRQHRRGGRQHRARRGGRRARRQRSAPPSDHGGCAARPAVRAPYRPPATRRTRATKRPTRSSTASSIAMPGSRRCSTR